MTRSAGQAAPNPPKTDGRVPDFFIVGHHKSGTTALYEMLRRHPQVYMPDLKEPRFLAADLRSLVEPTGPSALPQTLDEYLALFDAARPDQRVGEASPSYLRSSTAAGAIADLQPGARIIAILREPASFVRSMHLHLVKERVESENDLRKAFAHEELMRQGKRVLRYSDHVRYVEQLSRYHAVFARDQVLVVIYDDYRRDNEGTVRAVRRFLDVDDTLPVEAMDVNTGVRVRSVRLDAAARVLDGGRGPVLGAVRTSVKALTPGRLRRDARAIRRRLVYGSPTPPDESFMAELRHRFKPEVVALSDYLERDLVKLWGYEDID